MYPGIIGGSIVLYASLDGAFAPHVALAAGLGFGGALIILGEVAFPYRAAWQPSRGEVWLDSLFVAIVQVLFTLALAAALALLLQIQQQVGPATPFARMWPHHWPGVSQVVLMVIATDLLRYVVHDESTCRFISHRMARGTWCAATQHDTRVPATLYDLPLPGNLARSVSRKSVQLLANQVRGAVLDVGCGTGIVASELSHRRQAEPFTPSWTSPPGAAKPEVVEA